MIRKSAFRATTQEILNDVLGFGGTEHKESVLTIGRQRDGQISVYAAAAGYPVLEGYGKDLRSALIDLTLRLLRFGQLPSPFCLHTNLVWELAAKEIMEK